jgi:hypothetical protein
MASEKKKSNPVVLYSLLAVLIVGAIFLIIDRNSQSAAQEFYDALETAQDQEKTLTASEVQKLAGREPSAAYDHESIRHLFVEEYKWGGAIRSNTVYCYYQSAAEKLLDSFSINQPLDVGSL